MRTRVCSGCFELEQGCGQAASVENKGVFRLLLERKRVCSGCFGCEKGCGQTALGENKAVVCFW